MTVTTITILLFATLKERTGLRQPSLELSSFAIVADVRQILAERLCTLVESL